MKAKLEVLYADCARAVAPHQTGIIPVVRYSDACAAISKLESDLELKEALLKNSQKRCAELIKQLERMALVSQPPYVVEHHGAGRWDGKCKAL